MTCNYWDDCSDNSDEDVSNDTVCGMYINYCLKDVSYSDVCLILQSMLPQLYSTNTASTALQQ